MKKREKSKSSKKIPKSVKNKTKNYLRKTKAKKHYKMKNVRKSLKNKNRTKQKKHHKKIMRGGAIPFSELNPSTAMDHAMYGVKGMLAGSLIDNAQHVPNNLSHQVNPSVTNQPHLDGGSSGDLLNVAGESPGVHFASS